MEIKVRQYGESDLLAMQQIWNEVVQAGNAFPGTAPLDLQACRSFFRGQTLTAVAQLDGRVAGLYILHPNNIGRAGHIANASYAVAAGLRGSGVGEALVRHSLASLRPCGFRGLQFNAVVSTNRAAIALYEKLGFTRVGAVPGGFQLADGRYVDIFIYYHEAPPAPPEGKKAQKSPPARAGRGAAGARRQMPPEYR